MLAPGILPGVWQGGRRALQTNHLHSEAGPPANVFYTSGV